MFKMTFPVVLVSCKAAKDEKHNNYADFIFTGGSASLAVDSIMLAQLKPLEGEEIKATFAMKPRQIVVFDRSVTVFEPVKLLQQEI